MDGIGIVLSFTTATPDGTTGNSLINSRVVYSCMMFSARNPSCAVSLGKEGYEWNAAEERCVIICDMAFASQRATN